jgi:AcrR family transcriptional regulator
MTPPKQQRSEATVAAIVAAARELFGRHGFSAVSLDSVADECGRTKGAIYHHFATKEVLFEEVFTHEQRRLADDVVAAATSSDPLDSFTEGIAHYLSLIATDPIACRITLLDAPTVLGWMQWRNCDGGPFRLLCAGALDSMVQTGRLRFGQPPHLLADVILGAITEAALIVATSADPLDAASRLADCCATLISGIATQ